MNPTPTDWPASPSPGICSRERRPGFFVGWIDGPKVAASLISVLARRLLLDGDGANRGDGWGLLGSAAICF